MKKLIIGTVIAGLAVVLTAGAAHAVHKIVSPHEGGVWKHGVNYGTMWAYSDYLHNSKVHKSTACNKDRCVISTWEPGGVWSRAGVNASFGGNRAYYDVR